MLHEYGSFCDARLLNTTVIIFVFHLQGCFTGTWEHLIYVSNYGYLNEYGDFMKQQQ